VSFLKSSETYILVVFYERACPLLLNASTLYGLLPLRLFLDWRHAAIVRLISAQLISLNVQVIGHVLPIM
jgi:hypothetical protein